MQNFAKETWKKFIKTTRNKSTSIFVEQALEHVAHKDLALDLGGGALVETKHLVANGFKQVDVVDYSEAVQAERDALKEKDKVTVYHARFEDFAFKKERYDFINAQYSLPFTAAESFDRVFSDLVSSLKPGGVFTGQLFGLRDSWKKNRIGVTFHSKEKAQQLLQGLDVILFDEEERDITTAFGIEKHRHVFNIIAKKPIT